MPNTTSVPPEIFDLLKAEMFLMKHLVIKCLYIIHIICMVYDQMAIHNVNLDSSL